MDHDDDPEQPGQPMAMPVFAGQKLVVVGGSSGMGRQTAADVVAAGGSAVIIGEGQDKVEETVKALAKDGTAYGITADLTDRMQAERVCQQLADEHADATLLVNAAGLFVPKPFLDHDGADYDSYAELNRAIFFLTQTVVRGMVAAGRAGPSSTSAACGPTGHRGHPVVGVLAGQRRPARADPQPGPGARPHQIRVNPVAPAVVATPIYERFVPGPSSRRPCTASTASTRWAGPAPPATWPTPSPSCCPRPPAGSPAPSGTSTAASWPDATSRPGCRCLGTGEEELSWLTLRTAGVDGLRETRPPPPASSPSTADLSSWIRRRRTGWCATCASTPRLRRNRVTAAAACSSARKRCPSGPDTRAARMPP